MLGPVLKWHFFDVEVHLEIESLRLDFYSYKDHSDQTKNPEKKSKKEKKTETERERRSRSETQARAA